ncbi:hypothetical protein [Kineococcus auxinigenes]|uniref:hypothetical protein n=1 Tax=unclassified Kineococcus TaxID=2621656 RepID=UPI003D7CF797
MRTAAEQREPWIELRSAVPASAGRLFVREGVDTVERPVSCAVVRLDLSGPSPVILSSTPEDLPLWEERWELLQILSATSDASGECWLDPLVAVEVVLAGPQDQARTALRQWRGALRTSSPSEVLEQVTGEGGQPPEGSSWSSWGAWFEDRLERAARTGSGGAHPVREGPVLHRTGTFDRGVDIGAVVDESLVEGSEAVGAWLDDVSGPRRLRVVTELAGPVGVVQLEGPATTVSSRHVVVVLQRGADPCLTVLDAHPELSLEPAAQHHLRTGALLGAYLGPALERLEARPWPAQRALLEQEPAHVVEELVRELDDLTRLTDDDLRASVAAAGVAVLPRDLRGWLQRLTWRWRSFPWTTEG